MLWLDDAPAFDSFEISPCGHYHSCRSRLSSNTAALSIKPSLPNSNSPSLNGCHMRTIRTRFTSSIYRWDATTQKSMISTRPCRDTRTWKASPGRTPDAAYDYIRANLLLAKWNDNRSVVCKIASQDAYLIALDTLARDGFTHVILHNQSWNSARVADSFFYADAAYQDEFASIYRISDLRASCPSHLTGNESLTQLTRLYCNVGYHCQEK